MSTLRIKSLAVALAAAASILTAPAPAQAEVRIGAAGPLTGGYAWYGEQLLRGVEGAVEALNARGGVLGRQVQVVAADNIRDAEQGVAVARKLVADGVVFVGTAYAAGWPGLGSDTSRSCLGLEMPSVFRSSASSGPIRVR
jgi:branched-chain amino acid transport system substrate-binding protein